MITSVWYQQCLFVNYFVFSFMQITINYKPYIICVFYVAINVSLEILILNVHFQYKLCLSLALYSKFPLIIRNPHEIKSVAASIAAFLSPMCIYH